MINGLHGPNRAFTKADYDIIRTGNFRSVKLLEIIGCEHSLQEAKACLDAGAQSLLIRLPGSRAADGRYYSETDYVNKCADIIHQFFYGVGAHDFQFDNEPNWAWTDPKYGPWEYQWWADGVMQGLRASCPHGVEIFSPPLSFSPALWTPRSSMNKLNPGPWILDNWLSVFETSHLWTHFDRASVNIYYESDRQMADPSYGANYRVVYEHAKIQTVATEWACSAGVQANEDGKPAYTLHEVQLMQQSGYPRWLAQARDSKEVESAFVYISPGATPDWAVYALTPEIAKAMSTVLL